MSDTEVAKRVLGHIANKTTDRGDEVWRVPVDNYRPYYFDLTSHHFHYLVYKIALQKQ